MIFRVGSALDRNSSANRSVAKDLSAGSSTYGSAIWRVDPSSPWSRRIKVDIHDIDQDLLDQAIAKKALLETTIIGIGKDGSPASVTVRPAGWRIV
ncbi:DUF5990 family protein [Sphingobium sp. SA916]|uniref:DUF5990 family protein n=1 Tax=Sphingobium sp. SA916 TaxID=1851207 RepID=UPI00209C29A5|nr:DUF5990 family protein [Sphingobium sp. SA916]